MVVYYIICDSTCFNVQRNGTVKGQKDKKSEKKKLLETPGLEPGISRSEVKCVTDIPKHFP